MMMMMMNFSEKKTKSKISSKRQYSTETNGMTKVYHPLSCRFPIQNTSLMEVSHHPHCRTNLQHNGWRLYKLNTVSISVVDSPAVSDSLSSSVPRTKLRWTLPSTMLVTCPTQHQQLQQPQWKISLSAIELTTNTVSKHNGNKSLQYIQYMVSLVPSLQRKRNG